MEPLKRWLEPSIVTRWLLLLVGGITWANHLENRTDECVRAMSRHEEAIKQLQADRAAVRERLVGLEHDSKAVLQSIEELKEIMKRHP